MKTLTHSTDTSATYEFTHGDSTRVVVYDMAAMMLPEGSPTPDFAAMAESDHAKWLEWLGANE